MPRSTRATAKTASRAYSSGDLDAVYGTILFHGDQLRAIKAIDDYSDHGMTARLANAPKPEAWMQDPIQERWMADPMVLGRCLSDGHRLVLRADRQGLSAQLCPRLPAVSPGFPVNGGNRR
jgi:hypothetical protein